MKLTFTSELIIYLTILVIVPMLVFLPEMFEIYTGVKNIKDIRSAANSFFADTGTIPCTKSGGWLEDPGFVSHITSSNCWPNEGGCEKGCTDIAGWNGPYLEKWPQAGQWFTSDTLKYNWNRYNDYHGCSGVTGVITLEVYGGISQYVLQIIDAKLDDGNLSTGDVFLDGAGNYMQFLKCY